MERYTPLAAALLLASAAAILVAQAVVPLVAVGEVLK